MAHYLTCEHCQSKNAITSERNVFCQNCNKKLPDNYLDWKKSKFDSSFETYISHIAQHTEKESELISSRKKEMITIKVERRSVFKSFLKNKEAKILTVFIFCASFLTLLLTQEKGFDYKDLSNTNLRQPVTVDYSKDVNWKNYTISNDINLSLPFALKESQSVIPSYVSNHTRGVKSKKAEISNSFSVTVEEIELGDLTLNQSTFTDIKDAYMNDINTTFIDEPITEHMTIKDYKTQMAYGSYNLNGNRYNYQNYTLISDKKAVKIIISYLQNDKALCDYADIVSKSIYSNKAVI